MNDSNYGGGFDQSQAQGSGVTAESKPEGIVPMVIKQIHECPDSGLRLYDMVFGTVQIVAIVRSIEFTSTKITYVLEDHSGKIEAHTWLEEGDSSKAPHVVVNTYATVFGSVRNQGGTKTLIVFKIEPVRSPNEVTTHLLEVLNARYSSEHYAKKKNIEVDGHFRMDTTPAQNQQQGEQRHLGHNDEVNNRKVVAVVKDICDQWPALSEIPFLDTSDVGCQYSHRLKKMFQKSSGTFKWLVGVFLVTVPHNMGTERVIAHNNKTKSILRPNTGEKTMRNRLVISVNGVGTAKYDPRPAVIKFLQDKDRRNRFPDFELFQTRQYMEKFFRSESKV